MKINDVIPLWVYDLLTEYGNAVIPPEVIDYYGVKYTEELLTDIMGERVTIRTELYQDFETNGKMIYKEGYTAWKDTNIEADKTRRNGIKQRFSITTKGK